MSVIVKNQEGIIINFIKGADESITDKLREVKEFEENTILNVN
jgi:magnesium-transporting ATPase (P-type)